MDYGYGNWLFAVLNIILFLYFIMEAFKPRTKTDWVTFRSMGAFIVALFAEMYGFPLTIYLFTSFFGNKFFGLDFSHDNGHILYALLGMKGDPHINILHIISNVLIIGGIILIGSAWKILYEAQKKQQLATAGVYEFIRHPQYDGFTLIIVGFLLQWPTIITLIMAPILIWRYVSLSNIEETEMLALFGVRYRSYKEKTPAFFPSPARLLEYVRSATAAARK